jgi:hypothetical protein
MLNGAFSLGMNLSEICNVTLERHGKMVISSLRRRKNKENA